MALSKRTIKLSISQIYMKINNLVRDESQKVSVIYYHGVAKRAYQDQIDVKLFEEHMSYLAENCEVIPIEQIAYFSGEEINNDKPKVVISFDDGYRNLLYKACPILERYSLPATIFVIPGLLGKKAWWEADAPDEERILLSSDELRLLSSQNGISIGSHTWSHQDLTVIDSREAREEISRSKWELENFLGKRVNTIAYPYGNYNPQIVNMVRETGHEFAFTSRWGKISSKSYPLMLRRIFIESEDNIEELAVKVKGGYNWLGFRIT